MKLNKFLLPLCILLSAPGCRDKQKTILPEEIKNRPDSPLVSTPPPLAGTGYASIDISPMDMSYFPVDYPKLKMAGNIIDPPVARVIYSRPHLAKRHLFRDLLKYDEPWRLGANESTEIDFYRPVTIDGKKIIPGRYILYSIPREGKWTIVLNSNIDSWGLRQDPKKDIQHFDVPITTGNPVQEYFTLLFEKTNNGADLVISWDDIVTRLPIIF
jgi:Protein of unknown function (DUF2911)